MSEPSPKDLIAHLEGCSSSDQDHNETERMQLTDALRKSLHRLQTPFERAWEMTLADQLIYSAIETPRYLDELVNMCNRDCSPNLLREHHLVISVSASEPVLILFVQADLCD